MLYLTKWWRYILKLESNTGQEPMFHCLLGCQYAGRQPDQRNVHFGLSSDHVPIEDKAMSAAMLIPFLIQEHCYMAIPQDNTVNFVNCSCGRQK